MASTFINDLRLEEMATGENAGSWGTKTNTNLELIAEAFSFSTEGIATNADTHTTTIADGATDPGRSMYLKYTGALDSTCTITIGPNTVSKLWFIENGTSGSQDIIIKQGSGTTVTIPPGDTKAIYSDGAGSGGGMVDAFASLNVGAFTSNSASTITTADNTTQLTLISTDADANVGPVLDLNRNVTGADDDNLGSITFTAKDDAGNAQTFAKIDTSIRDASNSTEASRLNFHVASNGSVTKFLGFIGQTASAGAGTTFNEDGNDVDFRIESDTKPNAFSLNGATGAVGFNVLDGDVTSDGTAARQYVSIIGTANRGRLNLGTTASNGADAGTLAFTNGANTLVSLSVDTTSGVQNTGTLNVLGTRSIKIQAAASDEVVFNESGLDVDFRIEGDTLSNLFHVDAGDDSIGINSQGTGGALVTIQGRAGGSGAEITTKGVHIIEGGFNNGNTFQVSDSSSVARFAVNGFGSTSVGGDTTLAQWFNADGTYGTKFQVQTLGDDTDQNYVTAAFIKSRNDTSPSYVVIGKNRGGAANSDTTINGNDSIGAISFQGADGTTYQEAARISSEAGAGWGANDGVANIEFYTNSGTTSVAKRMTIQHDSGNNVEIEDGLTLKDGNLIMANGHGIDFSATGDATATSEILSDYEEGTWTPASPDVTLSGIQTSTYTRVGRMVFIQAKFIFPTSSSGSTARVNGLPFSVNGNGTNSQYNISSGEHTFGSYITCPVIPTTTIIFRPNGGNSASYATVSGKAFRLAGWYET